MKKNIVPLSLFIAISLYMGANFLLPLLSLFTKIDGSTFAQYRYFIVIASYICLVFVLLTETEKLESFNIDRFFLILLFLNGMIHVNLNISNEQYYKDVLIFLSLILLVVCIIIWKKIPKTNPRWALIGLLSSFIVIPLAFVESMQPEKYLSSNNLYQSHFVVYAIKNFLYNLAFVAPIEELIIRGVLWGQLRKWRLADSNIIWLQGILFWLLHFWQISTPITFFVTIPIITLILSLLVKYSKQIFPSMITHTLIDTLGPIFVYIYSR